MEGELYLRCDTPLRNAELIYLVEVIGRNFGKKGLNDLNAGITFIAGQFGTHKKNLVKRMLRGKRKSNKEVEWRFNRYYARIYHCILRFLKKCPPDTVLDIKKHLHDYYERNQKKSPKNEMQPVCANALIKAQKEALEINSISCQEEVIRKKAFYISRGIDIRDYSINLEVIP
jgi:hypothetical protein